MTKKYDKLVRDLVPEWCASNGTKAKTRIAESGEEFIAYLKKKVVEEAEEVAKAENIEEVKKELADLMEVFLTLQKEIDHSSEELKRLRADKNKKRGAFTKRIILESTEE